MIFRKTALTASNSRLCRLRLLSLGEKPATAPLPAPLVFPDVVLPSHPTLGRERHTWTLEISLPALYVILLLHPFIHTGFIHVFIELIQKKKNTRSIHTGRSLGPTKHSKMLCLRVTGGLNLFIVRPQKKWLPESLQCQRWPFRYSPLR